MNKSEVIKEIAQMINNLRNATGVVDIPGSEELTPLDLIGIPLTPEQARAYEELSLANVLDKPVSNFKIPVDAVIFMCTGSTKKDL